MKAYSNPIYARSLEEFGTPVHLQACDGWILKRSIPEYNDFDGMGCYPLFSCGDWNGLADDMEVLADHLVSLVFVAEPFFRMPDDVKPRFDRCIPFKEHFIVDLDRYRFDQVNSHHRYYARKASAEIDVDICAAPSPHLEEWATLYDNLIRRHGLGGIKAYSKRSFATIFSMPEMVMVRLLRDGHSIASMLWMVSDEVAYSHLVAVSEEGYRKSSSYALYYHSLEYFRGKVAFLDLGAGAGIKSSAKDGLSFFKGGWATGTRTAFLCGKILNGEAYDRLARVKGEGDDYHSYFPIYRQGEFT